MKWLALKPSQFNVIIPDYPEPGAHLVYNTLTCAIATIGNEGLKLLSSFENTTTLPRPTMLRDEKALAFISTLQKQGFLVPNEWNEGTRYLESLKSNNGQKGGNLEVTLLTNLQRCPLACKYCFQKGTHTGGSLDPKVVPFIKQQCLKLEVEKLWVSYYGSEPLSNSQAIVDTATDLQQFCQHHGILFRFGMVTSGVLLKRELVEQLVPLGFCQAQITIDGDKETHDATRPFQSGKGTYDLIMSNLEAYAGLIHTDVLSVVNEDRIPAVYNLIDTLAEKGLRNRKVRLLFSPESPDYSSETLTANAQRFADEGTKLWATEKKLLLEIAHLSIYAHERGLLDDLLPRRTWCAMQRHDERHLVIEPDGTIRTCPNLIGREEKYKAGNVDIGVGGIDTVIKEEYIRSEQCLSCRYLPICADCRVDSLEKTGDLLAPNTHEEEYDLIVPDLVKAHYRSRQRGASQARASG